MAASRTGMATRAAGASCLTRKEAARAEAQNEISSKSDKDIVEGGEKVG